jgi:hypothetical protein
MATSRETARDALTTLLTAGLSGTAQEVVGHRVSDPAGKTPVVAVLSGGTHRERLTFQGTRPTFYLTIQVLVLAEDATGYTEADAEDKLDALEAAIAGVLESNWRTTDWEALEQTDPSEVLDVAIGGHAYFLEVIPVAVRLAKS